MIGSYYFGYLRVFQSTDQSSCQSYFRKYMYQIYLLQESLLSVMQQLNQILSCEVEHCVNDFPFCHAFEKKNNVRKTLYAHYSSFLYCTHAFCPFSSQLTTFQQTFKLYILNNLCKEILTLEKLRNSYQATLQVLQFVSPIIFKTSLHLSYLFKSKTPTTTVKECTIHE